MNLAVLENREEIGAAGARLVRSLLEKRQCLTAAFPTGRTPLPFYAALRSALTETGLARRLRVFMLDEYLGLWPRHPRSFRSYLERELVRPLGIGSERFFLLDGAAKDPEVECRRYEEAITAEGGLDLAILGLGDNGHVAFNEPGTPASSMAHIAGLSEETRRVNAHDFGSLSEVPREALTAGIGTLRRARSLLMLVSGRQKAKALAALRSAPESDRVPATLLRGHPDFTVLADQEAAAGSILFRPAQGR
jgi:glucosamine-6-phosphate deaminase